MIKHKLDLLPHSPGCYLMKDKFDNIIYVGKAKDLSKRVRSYFRGAHDTKTEVMVSQVVDFEYFITSTEIEAFVLELNLIKKHDPKYNILFTDDKSYPYILLTNNDYPKLSVVRNYNKKIKGKLFGPYPNSYAARSTVELLNRLYPLRKCAYIPKKECLYYHIDQCLAPCINKVTLEEKSDIIKNVTSFLNGNYEGILKGLKLKMIKASDDLNFEKAQEYKTLIQNIEDMFENQLVEFNDAKNRDIFGISTKHGWLCVQVFFMRNGKLIERNVDYMPLINTKEEDITTFIGSFYDNNIKPHEIIIPNGIDSELLNQLLGIKITIPQKGNKKKLLMMANENAKISLKEKFYLIEQNEKRTLGAIEAIGKLLKIKTPVRIEAFDNSNIQGSYAVSGMAVFTNGRANKKEYRKFKVQSIEGPDDYGTMKEIIYRRYYRVLMNELKFPDLILVDGGKGQIGVTNEVLTELDIDIPVAGLKKDDKHNTSVLIYNDKEYLLDPKSNEFHLLSRIQDEVHRFSVSFHRKVRSKSNFSSLLDAVAGIGPKRKKDLLKQFGSVKNIKEASLEELNEHLPEEVATNLHRQLNIK